MMTLAFGNSIGQLRCFMLLVGQLRWQSGTLVAKEYIELGAPNNIYIFIHSMPTLYTHNKFTFP